MNPGVHHGVSMAEYLALRAISNSHLRLLKLYPPKKAAYKAANPKPTTAAQALGTAIHTAILEPDLFPIAYTVADRCEWIHKGGRCKNTGTRRHKASGWLCGTHAKMDGLADTWDDGAEVISRSDYLTCIGCRDSAWGTPEVAKHLSACEQREVVITGEHRGQLVKTRPDAVSDSWGMVPDIKTVDGERTNAGESSFGKEIFKRGYYRQQGLYRSVELWHGIDRPHRVLIPIEKEPPYLCGVYRLQDDVVTAGRNEAHALLTQWVDMVESGVWPGYPATEEVQDIGLPEWAWQDLEAIEPEDKDA